MSKLYPSVIKNYPDVEELERYEYMTNRSIGLFFDLQNVMHSKIPLKQFQMIDLFANMLYLKKIFSENIEVKQKSLE